MQPAEPFRLLSPGLGRVKLYNPSGGLFGRISAAHEGPHTALSLREVLGPRPYDLRMIRHVRGPVMCSYSDSEWLPFQLTALKRGVPQGALPDPSSRRWSSESCCLS